GWRHPWPRTIATEGTPTAAEPIITKTRTTRMLLPAAYVLRTTEGRTPRPPLRPRLLQREDEDGRAGREVLDLRPQRGIETEHERAEPARHRDVLLAVHRVADRAAAVAGAGAEMPQLLTGIGVVRVHDTFEITVDHEAAAGGKHAADRRVFEIDAPLALTGHRVARVEMTVRLAARRM